MNKKLLLKGIAASSGQAEDVAKVVSGAKDALSFKDGYILVAEMTEPSMVIMMNKAAAIVTDKGGLTSHAAIVSRELGIPAIVGTRYATKVFNNGDIVEMKLNHGKIQKIQNG